MEKVVGLDLYPVKRQSQKWRHLYALCKIKNQDIPRTCQEVNCSCSADSPHVILDFLVWLCGHSGRAAEERGSRRIGHFFGDGRLHDQSLPDDPKWCQAWTCQKLAVGKSEIRGFGIWLCANCSLGFRISKLNE